MPVAIITDSAAALPDELVERHHIAVVPMWLTIGGESVREGDVTLESLLERHDVTTSGPTPGEFENVIKERLAEPGVDAVVVCTIAATMSSTYEAAVIGARAPVGRCASSTPRRPPARRAWSCSQRPRRPKPVDHPMRWKPPRGSRRACATCRDGPEPRSSRAQRPGPEHRGLGRPAPRYRAAVRVPRWWRAPDAPGSAARTPRSTGSSGVASVTGRRRAPARRRVARVRARDRGTSARRRSPRRSSRRPRSAASFGTVMVVHTGPGLAGLAWHWEPQTPQPPQP